LALDKAAYAEAIESIEDALLITLGRESIEAAFLRLRVLGGNLMFTRREQWEQNPANALEAAYVNLGYAVARERGHQASKEVLEEGLELVPSSVYLRHALARLHLSQRRADLANPIYDELAEVTMPDGVLANEVQMYRRLGGRRGRKR
jgi:Tfp pilus assembly protein PilF